MTLDSDCSSLWSDLQAASYNVHDGAGTPVQFVRNTKARRYILKVRSGGVARVTIPRGGTLEFARAFAEKHKGWIEQQVRKASAAWTHGTVFLLRGVPVTLLLEEGRAVFGPYECRIVPGGNIREQVEAELRAMAEQELTERTKSWAAQLGVRISSIRVRNQRSRWGSCSSKGAINLNWRLIQTPPVVLDYIIVHELMHRREMNHSRAFWEHVAAAYPEYRDAERWLRRNGALLR